jgi:release factor glutamine methyltransferase
MTRSATTTIDRLAVAVRALRSEAETRELARSFAREGIRVLALKGPALQARLYGTPAEYPSGDVDLLVPKAGAGAARRTMEEAGWTFEAGNGVLWRLSGAATYVRGEVRVDLHWGLHAAHLPARTLKQLERALWAGARPGPSGLLEPDPESLLVFLAVHAAGHRFERPEWTENVRRCSSLVCDWDRVWRIAREARVERAAQSALDGIPTRGPLLDGHLGRAIWAATWLARGHFLPPRVRETLRGRVASLLRRRSRTCRFAGLDLTVDPGVFVPQSITERLVRLTTRVLADRNRALPVLVDVGTGSGAVALSLARAIPDAEVHATDVSTRAIRCARRNRRRLRLGRVRFHRGSLLEPLPRSLSGGVAAVVANIPYVPMIGDVPEALWAPRGTFEGSGQDGADLIRELARQATKALEPGGWMVLQLADGQWDRLAQDLASLGYRPIEPEERRAGRALVAAAQWSDAVPGEGTLR